MVGLSHGHLGPFTFTPCGTNCIPALSNILSSRTSNFPITVTTGGGGGGVTAGLFFVQETIMTNNINSNNP